MVAILEGCDGSLLRSKRGASCCLRNEGSILSQHHLPNTNCDHVTTLAAWDVVAAHTSHRGSDTAVMLCMWLPVHEQSDPHCRCFEPSKAPGLARTFCKRPSASSSGYRRGPYTIAAPANRGCCASSAWYALSDCIACCAATDTQSDAVPNRRHAASSRGLLQRGTIPLLGKVSGFDLTGLTDQAERWYKAEAGCKTEPQHKGNRCCACIMSRTCVLLPRLPPVRRTP